jgi:ribosomal protein S3AE
VVHDIGLDVGEKSIDRKGVKKVRAIGTVHSSDGVALKIQMCTQVTSDKAGSAGD